MNHLFEPHSALLLNNRRMLWAATLLLLVTLALLYPAPAGAAGITVTTASDSIANDGECSLREAIINANNNNQSGSTECVAGSGDDTITFAGDYTITLTAALPSLNGTLTIDGSGRSVTVSGNNAWPIFQIPGSGRIITFSDLRMIDGLANIPSNCSDPCGGAIYNNFGTVTVINSTISGNSADFGGGIQNTGTLTVVNSTLSGNSATVAASSRGAGIHNAFGTVLIVNSTLSGNVANDFGGGIRNGSGTLTVINSTLSGNSARIGGGIYIGDSTVTVANSTLSGNSADFGGGIFNSSNTLHLSNTILANSPRGGDCYNTGSITTNLNNLIENGSCSPALSGDPLLSPLGSYGGSTQTFALLPGSPAIDAGDSTTCADASVNSLDQRGIARPTNCDIGAFESRGFTLGSLSGTPQGTTINTPFASSLGLTVSSDFDEPVGPGGRVTLTAPNSGASVIFAPTLNISTAANGGISRAVTANGVAGSYVVTADSRGAASSASFSLTNQPYLPTVSVSSSLNPSIVGQSVTLTATVSGNGSPVTGEVGFVIDGGAPISVTLSGGQGVLTTSSLTAGNHTVTAHYSGDGNHNPSSGSLAGGQVVNQATTTTSLVSSLNPSVVGQSVTFTATVSVVPPGADTPTGEVGFVIDGGAPISVTLSGSQAALTTSSLTAGNHIVTANYSGDSSHNASSGSLAGGQTVGMDVIYLPLISNQYISAPDLVVREIIATGSTMQVVIQNQGNAAVPVSSDQEFWVDLYVDPNPPPNGVNQTCQSTTTCADFAAWGVTTALLPQLTPGGMITLTVGDVHQYYGSTSMNLPVGSVVYAQVDSYNSAATYGVVQESDEDNNIGSMVSVAGGAGVEKTAVSHGRKLSMTGYLSFQQSAFSLKYFLLHPS